MEGESDKFFSQQDKEAQPVSEFAKVASNGRSKEQKEETTRKRAAWAYGCLAVFVGFVLLAVLSLFIASKSDNSQPPSPSPTEEPLAPTEAPHTEITGPIHDAQTIHEGEVNIDPTISIADLDPTHQIAEQASANTSNPSNQNDTVTAATAPETDEAFEIGNDVAMGDNENALYWYRNQASVLKFAKECDEVLLNYKPGTYMYEMKLADCGLGYKMPVPNATARHWRIGLIGDWITDPAMRLLSGCEFGHTCPLSPNCAVVPVSKPDQSRGVDVLAASAFDFNLMRGMPRKPNQIRVIYWREAKWGAGFSFKAMHSPFDLEMGVHHFASLNNPSFILPPSFLVSGIFQGSKKSEFAASVISDCKTMSQRQTYINHMLPILGPHRLHQYGRCGHLPFPTRPMFRGFQILSKYRYFLAFENTIQTGYSTEKLFLSLLLPVIPVYYGDPLAPNITTTPSYIKVSDFNSPRHLSEYLIYLAENPSEYEKYHAWRKNPEPFQMEYLRKAQQIPGPREVMAHELAHSLKWLSNRRAMCCRLCDEAYLRNRIAVHTSYDEVNKTFGKDEIARRFYGGAHVEWGEHSGN